MGQFKPMVKMYTTEPSVELKLKKGGHVSMKSKKEEHGHKMMDGGVPPAPARGGMAPAAAPLRPSMAARRRAMMAMPAGAAPAAPVGMAGRMMKEGGESKAEHKAEMKKFSKLEGELKSHEGKPASKAHKGLATGGVVMGQGGFKKGGKVKKMAMGGYSGPIVAAPKGGNPALDMDLRRANTLAARGPAPGAGQAYVAKGGKVKKMAAGGALPVSASERGAEEYVSTKMDTTHPDHSPANTGGVKMGNAGGYKKGGKAKKYAEGGSVNWENRPADTAHAGVTNTKTGEVRKGNAGGYKKGGAAKKAYATGGLVDTGRPVAMPQGHKRPPTPVSINQLSGTYKKGGKVQKMNGGGVPEAAKSDIQTARNQRAYKEFEKSQAQEAKSDKDFLPNLISRGASAVKNLFSSMKPVTDKEREVVEKASPESVTKTRESVTVSTPKKRGGAVKC